MYTKRKSSLALVCLSIILFAGALPAEAFSLSSTSSNSVVNLAGNSGPVLGALATCAINEGIDILNQIKYSAIDDPQNAAGFPVGGLYGIVSAANRVAAAARAQRIQTGCITPLEHAAGQVLIKTITDQTVDWINHGLKGQPLYIRDTQSFLEQIRDQQVGDFVTTISDPTKYPFGKEIAQGLINDLRGYFEQNAAYSLDRVVSGNYPGHTGADFQADFAIGGWPAFISLQSPNNNPYGFQLDAQDALSRRIDNTYYPQSQNIKDQIQRGMGFLDLRKCVDPATYDDKKLAAASAVARNPASSAAARAQAAADMQKYRCNQWTTQTPGSVIANRLNDTLGSPLRQLELGQDLSASLTAVFDALLKQMVEKGLSSIESSSGLNDYGDSGNYASNVVVTSGDDTGGPRVNEASQWYNQYPQFNVLTDLPTVIALEQNYQNTVQTEVDTTKKVVAAIYELDMCIPGPNPSWETTATQRLSGLIASIPSGGSVEHGNFLSTKLGILTFKTGGGDGPGDLIASNTQVSDIIESIFTQYKSVIRKTYNASTLPNEAGPAAQEYRKLPQYEDDILSKTDAATLSAGFIKQLQALQVRVDALGLPASTDPTYAAKLAALRADPVSSAKLDDIKNAFDRTAPYLQTDLDVSSAKTELGTLNDTLSFLSKPGSGLIDQCINDTKGGTGALTRLPYPADLTANTHGFTLLNTFLPTYTYGTFDGNKYGTYDGPKIFNFGPELISPAYKAVESTSETKPSGPNEIHISDLLLLGNAGDLSKFEKAISIY